MVTAPELLNIGITERCNSRCVMCSHEPSWDTEMSLGQFAAIVDAFPESPRVKPQHFGEPMMHPCFIDIIRLIKERGRTVLFYTNGSLLTGDILDAMVELMVAGDSIIFSVEGFDAGSYESIRRGLGFDVLVENVAAFQTRKRPGVISEVRMTEIREVDTKAAFAFWTPRVDLVWSVPEEPFSREVKGHYDIRYDSRTCHQPRDTLTVTEAGDALLCCGAGVKEKTGVVGNVFTEGARAVWFGNEMERWRHEAHPLCSQCLVQWVNEE